MNMRLDQGKQFKMRSGVENSMKTASTILILILLAHLQCGGSCVIETLKHSSPATSDPPCHQHNQNPEKERPVHQSEGTCSQGPLIESKALVKRVALPELAMLPAQAAIEVSTSDVIRPLDIRIPFIPPAPQSVSILRI